MLLFIKFNAKINQDLSSFLKKYISLRQKLKNQQNNGLKK
nr:MAG TPA: hypothetical protein [Bacteriophage sp.]DAQ65935.1 MAG TPA: hypothetical protein [Bacteriophage sp.]